MLGKLLTVSACALALATAAQAETFEVQMLNKGAEGTMVFEPNFIHAQVGDTVHFVPTDKGHNVESIDGMLPDGVAEFEGKISHEYTLTLEKEGIYGYKCKPHYALGMVGLIQVGAPVNLESAEAVKQKGKAKAHFAALFEKVEQ